MYLHVGNDTIIKKSKIIGIFNLCDAEKSKVLNGIDLIHIDEKWKESVVLTEENKRIKAYISNISAGTLMKRTNSKEKEQY